MACINDLDMSRPIVKVLSSVEIEIRRQGTPTAEFEELWKQLSDCLEDFEARITALEP
jgi:hypothetical protein